MSDQSTIVRNAYLRDGVISVTEKKPGVWLVTWTPHREDHPDYPGLSVDSSVEPMPVDEGPDAIVEWACLRFENRDPRDLLEVHLDVAASDDEIAEVGQAFDEAGLPAVASANISHRSAVDVPWVVYVVVPAAVFATAFARAAGTAAGADAWQGLKTLVSRVCRARNAGSKRDGAIQLEIDERTVILTDDVPDEGIRQVANGELPAAGYYVWDDKRGGWNRTP